jgi:hypothetical protein
MLVIDGNDGDPGSSLVGGESGGMVSGAVAAFREADGAAEPAAGVFVPGTPAGRDGS